MVDQTSATPAEAVVETPLADVETQSVQPDASQEPQVETQEAAVVEEPVVTEESIGVSEEVVLPENAGAAEDLESTAELVEEKKEDGFIVSIFEMECSSVKPVACESICWELDMVATPASMNR